MKSITLDTAEESVLLVVKGIGGVKNGLFDVERLSHTTDYEFNEMSLSDVRRFAVEEDFFSRQSTIVATLVLIVFSEMHH